MNITDNLKKDISNAPEWFQDAIVSKSEVKVLEAELGNVSYKCWGKGTNDKTIVLIHGTGASKNWWDPIAPFISDEYRVIAQTYQEWETLITEMSIAMKFLVKVFYRF
ncbi:MAG: hypothetical protein Ct9H90mP6_06660 [Gammaproteobacteria bacterium]|nr:MAG: hypothetical protein Ct9H90mP6_06660 [Gammaproteobacteria bacterium]